MGLDMYLSKRIYVGNKWKKEEEKVKLTGSLSTLDTSNLQEIILEVGYWRKANHIHHWFVSNVQGGNDDCGEYPVDAEKLKELLDTCKKVLANTKLVNGKVVNGYKLTNYGKVAILEDGKVLENATIANELLPTKSGFFFGGTDYDEYYLQDIEETVKILEKVLAEKNSGYFYYQSSW